MYLDNIVDYINAQVKLRMGAKASHSRFYGICKIVEKDDAEKTVVLYDNAGNDVLVQDDSNWLFVYHRFLGYTFQLNEVNAKDSFGDGASTKSAIGNFVMGVYGNREFLEMTDQQLTASVAFNFPDVVPLSLIESLTGLKNVIISPLQTNNIPTSEPMKPSAEDIFFTLTYRIAFMGDVSCLADCEPNCI